MFVEVAEGLLTAVAIYEKRSAIGRLAGRWLRLLFQGNVRVGVFGAGGTGKTTLGLFVKGELDTDRPQSPYAETVEIQQFNVAGEIPALLSVVPGQEARRPGTWQILYGELASGKSFRVINVVSWGYHASGLERARHRAFSQNLNDEEFRTAYFEDSRREEINALRALVPHLKATPGLIRMITLVTKQDLWWDRRKDAEAFYTTGEYRELLSEIERYKGVANFRHDLLSCALVEQNLRMADGFVLAQTVAGYDDALRVANLDRAALAIDQVIST